MTVGLLAREGFADSVGLRESAGIDVTGGFGRSAGLSSLLSDCDLNAGFVGVCVGLRSVLDCGSAARFAGFVGSSGRGGGWTLCVELGDGLVAGSDEMRWCEADTGLFAVCEEGGGGGRL